MIKGVLRILNGDLFDVCGQLKAIDEGYFVAYNVQKKRFEVHNAGQRGNTLALVVPYAELDARTVTLTKKTRAERTKALLAELNEDNRKLEKQCFNEKIRKAERQAEQALSNL